MYETLPGARVKMRYGIRLIFGRQQRKEKNNPFEKAKMNREIFGFDNDLQSAFNRFCNNDPGDLLHRYTLDGQLKDFVTIRTNEHQKVEVYKKTKNSNTLLQMKYSSKYIIGNLLSDAVEDYYYDYYGFTNHFRPCSRRREGLSPKRSIYLFNRRKVR
jgi:hypothetical protein